mgnify:FL=1
MKTITINGNEYPCRITMGAMLRFKRETGRDVSEMGNGDVSDLLTLLWCCVASACAGDGVTFGMSLMDFADRIDPEAISGFYNDMEAEKKTEPADSPPASPPTS